MKRPQHVADAVEPAGGIAAVRLDRRHDDYFFLPFALPLPPPCGRWPWRPPCRPRRRGSRSTRRTCGRCRAPRRRSDRAGHRSPGRGPCSRRSCRRRRGRRSSGGLPRPRASNFSLSESAVEPAIGHPLGVLRIDLAAATSKPSSSMRLANAKPCSVSRSAMVRMTARTSSLGVTARPLVQVAPGIGLGHRDGVQQAQVARLLTHGRTTYAFRRGAARTERRSRPAPD